MKSQVLNKIAVAINKIVDWGIDLAYATAHIVYLVINRMYRELKTRKGRAYSLRVLLGILFVFVIVEIYTTEKNYLNPLVKAWEDDKVRIEELERKLNEANDRMYELEEYRQGLLQGDKEAITEYIRLKFSPLGEDAVEWALFAAKTESGFLANPHNWNDDHSSWCHKENGSHGLFHFSHCTFEGLGGKDIMSAKEQIDIVSRPDVYGRRSFYWYNTTIKFERQKHLTSL